MSQELKVGIVVSIGLMILAGLLIGVGGIKLGEKGYQIKVLFNYVSGLDKHSPVRLAGMECGEVKKMTLKNGRVEVDLWLKEEAKLYEDAIITINMLGLLGEAYIEIDPGSKGSFLKDQDVIVGKDPTPVSEILVRGEEIAKRLDSAILKIDNMLGGEENKEEIGEIIKNIKDLTLNLNLLVVENREDIKVTFKNIKETLDSLNREINKASNTLLNIEKSSSKTLKEIDHLLEENREGIKGATLEIEKGAKRFNQVLSDLEKAASESKANVDKTIDSFNQAIKELRLTLNSVHNLVQQVESKDGMLSRMIYDKEMADNLAGLIKHLNNLAADLEKNPWKLIRKN